MLKLPIDQDQILKQLATESIRKGEDIRNTVRDLTLKSLHGRQMTLAQIRDTLRTVTEGVNLGVSNSPLDPEKLISDAFAGMDDALLKAVEANRIALAKLTGDGQSFEQSQMKKALDELERYEDTLLRSVKQASTSATDRVRGAMDGPPEEHEARGHRHRGARHRDPRAVRGADAERASRVADGRTESGPCADEELRNAGQRRADRTFGRVAEGRNGQACGPSRAGGGAGASEGHAGKAGAGRENCRKETRGEETRCEKNRTREETCREEGRREKEKEITRHDPRNAIAAR
jgi:hypothetical protein